MREIEFRVKSTTGDKLWTYIHLPNIFDRGSVWYEGHDWSTLGQYTGLRDRHGLRVYEGDIIRRDEGHWNDCTPEKCAEHGFSVFPVEWDDARDDIEVGYLGFYIGYTREEDIEVIGTIYENKDLL